MRAQCFKNYTSCVLEADYWAIAHDLDCALTLTGCVGDYVFGRTSGDGAGEDAERSGRTRAALERHSDDLKQLNERIRAAGPEAANDDKLEKELDRLIDKVQRETERQPAS